MLDRNGLAIDDPVHFGGWSGRADTLSWQKVVVARKVWAGCSAHPRRPLVHRLLHRPLQRHYWRSATYAAVARARRARHEE